MDLQFRLCEMDDLPLLTHISRSTFRDAFAHKNTPDDLHAYLTVAFSESKLREQLSNENSEFYFACLEDKVVGYIKINSGLAQSELKEELGMEIERIYVLQDFQGKGIGKELLLFAIDLGKARNKAYVWLGVWEKNTDAIRFYQRHGFVKFGAHSFMLGHDLQTDHLMKLNLQKNSL